MKNFKVFSLFIGFLVISLSFGAPMTEDDEYDDDPEYPERKAQELAKFQEELAKQGSTTSSTTTIRPQRVFSKQRKKWTHAKEVRGYQILSDGPKIETEMVKTRPMLRIRVEAPGKVRDVEKMLNKRNLELKIRNWDKVHKVHIKVPFGYLADDLRVVEMRDHIDIVAPIYVDDL
ncbi:hypothetical protein Ocin01_09882 [Orchesella cincta]|uniref:Uncharacterized protein n=1 Tax=Orchesella cincta TaxID=48709 RepID=A0A1D2MUL9_ORCCI|nr:hypothetical protein Ocin01_09882 [Orchesella cincta]